MSAEFPLALKKDTVLAGQFIVEEVLGQGGFGITYKAKDYKNDISVAIKEYFPDAMATRNGVTVVPFTGDREENYKYGLDCFLREAETLAKYTDNENISKIICYFEENATAYFVMEFIEGESFDDYIKRNGGKIPYADAERVLLPIMDALATVHKDGVVHRDVTPDNIYITNEGVSKLLDFGAARYSIGDKSRSLDVVLKHGYAPKEQYTRHGKQAAYTDIYTLGVCFYRAITGELPEDSIDRLEVDDVKKPSELGVEIDKAKESVIMKAMAVQPANRYQTMEEFKNALLSVDSSKEEVVPNFEPVKIEGKKVDCPYCGGKTLTNLKSCQVCGKNLEDFDFEKIDEKSDEKTDDNKTKNKKSKKRNKVVGISLALILVAAAVVMIFFPCLVMGHNYLDATCTTPVTCTKCGKTIGNPYGHNYLEATCEKPATCVRCGSTTGDALGHDYAEATCEKPETCTVCGNETGKALGHDYSFATCTEAAKCKTCGKKMGSALGHKKSSKPTKSTGKYTYYKCETCGEEVKETFSTKALENDIIDEINQYREDLGLDKIVTTAGSSTSINKAAATRAKELESSYSYNRPDGTHWSTVLNESGIYFYSGGCEYHTTDYFTGSDILKKMKIDSVANECLSDENLSRIGIATYVDSDEKLYIVIILLSV